MDEQEFTDAHRLFLQTMRSCCILTKTEAHRKWQEIRERGDGSLFPAFISFLNESLQAYADLQLRNGFNEMGVECIALVNSNGTDEISQLSSSYSASEINYFKAIVALIMENKLSCSSTKILNIASSLTPSIKKTAAEDLMWKFTKDQCDGILSLSIRSILELDLYLTVTYPDCDKKCFYCKELLLYKHDICLEEDCTVAMHTFCAATCFDGKPVKKCPSCFSVNWKTTHKKSDNRRESSSHHLPRRVGTEEKTHSSDKKRGKAVTSDSESDADESMSNEEGSGLGSDEEEVEIASGRSLAVANKTPKKSMKRAFSGSDSDESSLYT